MAESDEAVRAAQALLSAGGVVAVKGIGGFHLACDARDEGAVGRIRVFKNRPHKPMAVMCRDIDAARSLCDLSRAEEAVLRAASRPIILLKRREAENGAGEEGAGTSIVGGAGSRECPVVADNVAPGSEEIGVMLPYTPIHHLIVSDGAPPCLLMTSGNRRDEPIITAEDRAVAGLGPVCDALLVHDRPIWNRCDDSVGFVQGQKTVLTRRSRGFAPLPVDAGFELRPVLALGAQLSSTFAVGARRRVFLSQHIGDLDNVDTLVHLRESIDKFLAWLGLEPEIVACDMHPDLLSTRLARELAEGRRLVPVQHHHAHFAAALAAAGVTVEAQGLVLDGTGWGPGGEIWGGEILVGSAEGFDRVGHLRPLPLPGGDIAIHRPIRTAAAYLHAMVPSAAEWKLPLWKRMSREEARFVRRMVDRGFNAPMTTSAGRLFDAVSSILGVRDTITYEGQAAVELEWIARKGDSRRSTPLEIKLREKDGKVVLDPTPLFSVMAERVLRREDPSHLAAGFHAALADALGAACASVRDAGGPRVVALCGGVFQNRILTPLTIRALEGRGLCPIAPGHVPVNDGGLALGQAVVAGAAPGESTGRRGRS
jgi:hydrogenase maturation protein HypF